MLIASKGHMGFTNLISDKTEASICAQPKSSQIIKET